MMLEHRPIWQTSTVKDTPANPVVRVNFWTPNASSHCLCPLPHLQSRIRNQCLVGRLSPLILLPKMVSRSDLYSSQLSLSWHPGTKGKTTYLEMCSQGLSMLNGIGAPFASHSPLILVGQAQSSMISPPAAFHYESLEQRLCALPGESRSSFCPLRSCQQSNLSSPE